MKGADAADAGEAVKNLQGQRMNFRERRSAEFVCAREFIFDDKLLNTDFLLE